MKFLALKEALEKSGYEQKQTDKSVPKHNELGDEPRPHRTFLLGRSEAYRVDGGVVLWKPINKQAALILAKAPWWAKPLPEIKSVATPVTPEKPKKTKKAKMSLGVKTRAFVPVGCEAEIVHTNKSADQFNAEILTALTKKVRETMDKTEELVDRATDARAAMATLCESFQQDWVNFIDTSDARLKELRITRMAVDTEMRQIMSSLREVRAFFLDKDYESERTRLLDFVQICERLKALKESGFLDTVADTMLHLSK